MGPARMDREGLEAMLKEQGIFEEKAFSRLMISDQPSWRLPLSRTLHMLLNTGPFGYDIYEGPVRLGLTINWGYVDDIAILEDGYIQKMRK